MNTTNPSQPLVSVIMAVFNGEAYLDLAIRSALAQTYDNFELIVIDDESTDTSPALIQQHARDSRLRFVRNAKNMGVAASRNRGLELARGELIAFLDQDDIWLPEKLAIQLAAIQAHPQVGLMHSGYARIDPQGTLLEQYRGLSASHFANPDATVDVRDVFAEIFISNDIQPLTTLIPRAILDGVGPFDPELPGVDDYELWLRIALHHPVGRIDTILGYWRAHPGQQSNLGHRMLTIRLEALERILRRFPEARQRVPDAALRNRMHRQYSSAANYAMYHLRDYPAARRYFGDALRYRWHDVAAWGKYGYCALPAPVRTVVKALKNLFQPSPSANK